MIISINMKTCFHYLSHFCFGEERSSEARVRGDMVHIHHILRLAQHLALFPLTRSSQERTRPLPKCYSPYDWQYGFGVLSGMSYLRNMGVYNAA